MTSFREAITYIIQLEMAGIGHSLEEEVVSLRFFGTVQMMDGQLI